MWKWEVVNKKEIKGIWRCVWAAGGGWVGEGEGGKDVKKIMKKEKGKKYSRNATSPYEETPWRATTSAAQVLM